MAKYIYVITPETEEYCKIGFSKNPNQRVLSAQTFSPEKLKIYYTEEFDDDIVKTIEKCLHRTINRYRMNGEWFNISPETAKLEIIHAKIYYEDDISKAKFDI